MKWPLLYENFFCTPHSVIYKIDAWFKMGKRLLYSLEWKATFLWLKINLLLNSNKKVLFGKKSKKKLLPKTLQSLSTF